MASSCDDPQRYIAKPPSFDGPRGGPGRKKRKLEATAKPKRGGNTTDIAGWMPKRGDFDVEYDNDAELPIADMEFSADDPKPVYDLKVKMLALYNARLDERERKKKFVLDRGLLDYRKTQQKEKSLQQDERQILVKLRPFARFLSVTEHDDLVKGLVEELRLRKRIAKLQEYRQFGIRTLAEAREFETLKKSRKMGQPLPSSWKSSVATAAPTPQIPPIDIRSAPGAAELAEKEILLCSSLKLLPRQYLSIKNVMIKEALRRGFLQREQAREFISMDVCQTDRVYDFFVSCGWIASDPKPTEEVPHV